MQTKKQNLITSLNIAIDALKNGTVLYDWTKQESCNCGVVAQAVLKVNKTDMRELWLETQNEVSKHVRKDQKREHTWRDAVVHLCPITGEPLADVFKRLFEAGLTKEDIVHLEYMNNPAILERAKINTNQTRTVVKIIDVVKPNPNRNLLQVLFGLNKTVKVKEEKKVQEKIDHYSERQNLIAYLQGWVSLLKEGAKYHSSDNLTELTTEQLQTELLNAVAEENYEYATELRNTINERK